MNLRQILQATDALTDAELEAAITEIRQVRQARREAIAVERAWHTATGGISTRIALEASPAGIRQHLIASYAAAGLSPSQIETRLLGLQRGG